MDRTFENEYGRLTLNADTNPKMVSVFERSGYYQKEVVETLLAHLPSFHGLALDIGAHVGVITVPLARKAAEVHAFEPTPESARYLQRNIRQNGLQNVQIHQMALGARSGKVSMATGANASSFDVAGEGDTPMLDSFDFDRVDLIKIDVEGFEPEVLESARRTIWQERPVIFFELNLPQLRKHGRRPLARIEKLLPDYSFFINGAEHKRLWHAAIVIEPKYFLLGWGSGTTFDVLALPKAHRHTA